MRALVCSAEAIGRREALATPCSSRYSSAALLNSTFRPVMIRSLHVTVVTVKSPHLAARGEPMSSKRAVFESAAVRPSGATGDRGRMIGAIAVTILLQLPWPGWLFPGESPSAQAARELVFWLMTGLLLAYVLVGERRPLRSVGLVKPGWKSLVWGLAGGVVMIAIGALIYMVLFPALGMTTSEKQLDDVKALPQWFLVGLVTRAAVFEEFFYRGFVIERFAELSERRWLAALVSLALFTFAHLSYWGWSHLIVAGSGGLVLTALYLFRRDLASNMLAHWLTDVAGLLLA